MAVALHHAGVDVAFGGALMCCAVWLAGRIARDQRELVTQLRAANLEIEAERDARIESAVHAERLRIVDDLQSIVAAAVAAMVVQAEAADQLLSCQLAATGPAIGAIESTGRRTLAHLRRVLGVLRNPDAPAPRRPPASTKRPTMLKPVPARAPS